MILTATSDDSVAELRWCLAKLQQASPGATLCLVPVAVLGALVKRLDDAQALAETLRRERDAAVTP